ncbi:thiamine phosphate synthase [Planctomycetota bacterium]
MRPQFNPALYLVTDRPLCGERGLETVVEAAVRGGVTLVQLREKNLEQDEFIRIARKVRNITRPYGLPLIINDDVEVALAAGAEGVHIGQSDMAYPQARQRMGPDALIGLSVETMEQVRQAEEWDIDYLGISPIFATPTKTDTAPPPGV